MKKVATIIGLFGACRREELCELSVDNIKHLKHMVLAELPDTKTKIKRTFTVIGKYIEYYRKYISLRPSNVSHRRFFLRFRNNK